jgi:serine/threonine protein kinase
MAGSFRYKEGEQFGPWSLIEPLGQGGNAEVWKASHSNGSIVALKILYQKDPNSEPYKRFKAEVGFLRSLPKQTGVLSVIDASLPQQPSKKNRAWLAMPIATPITDALDDSPDINTVVEAIVGIAETLALLADKKVSHRDIKPGNLYSFDGRWTIGDFGLVEYPDKEALTADGKTLGPLYFMAPEMLSNPKDAEGYPADVYSLAKTFWVLATGQTYPPQGEQRIDVPQVTLGHYINHPKIRMLDRLIENATRHDPKGRPSMKEFASELRAWLAPQVAAASPADLSDLFKRI